MTRSSTSIVVVDDEIELANLFKIYLQNVGFDTISFTDPRMALEYIRDNSKTFSLILTDLRMPHMSGIDLAVEIRKLDEKIKIVLITAFMTEDLVDDHRFKNAKIDRVVQKPIKFRELRNSIAQLLNQPLNI
ncbi:MAG TPA: response regulator [Candidatus Nitrosocosmicus sp.]|nr:response regulator [Candidatus Nitrosocosmicus sp.]